MWQIIGQIFAVDTLVPGESLNSRLQNLTLLWSLYYHISRLVTAWICLV